MSSWTPKEIEAALIAASMKHDILRGLQITILEAILDELPKPSRMSAEEARNIWQLAVAIRHGDIESMHELRKVLAAHAPDWGNND